jgi:putative transposase
MTLSTERKTVTFGNTSPQHRAMPFWPPSATDHGRRCNDINRLTNWAGIEKTYVRVKGAWKYLYRAVDKAGTTVDFLLTAKLDRKAALRFLRKAIKWNGTPEKITIDKSGANTAAIESHNAETEAGIEIRQIKYLNNIVEQDHRAIKRLVRPMLGFKSFRSAAVTLAGIEFMHIIRKGQLQTTGEVCPARQFYSLAG